MYSLHENTSMHAFVLSLIPRLPQDYSCGFGSNIRSWNKTNLYLCTLLAGVHYIHVFMLFLSLTYIPTKMSTNGYFSFGSRVNDFNPSLFPTEDGYTYFVSPFWADATIEGNVSGQVSYEVHSAGNGTQPSGLLSNISVYISEAVGEAFQGDWMLVGEWKEVPPVTGLNIEVSMHLHFVENCTLLKMGCYSSTMMCQYWDNC